MQTIRWPATKSAATLCMPWRSGNGHARYPRSQIAALEEHGTKLRRNIVISDHVSLEDAIAKAKRHVDTLL